MKRYIIFIFLLFSIGAGAQVLTKNYTPYEWMQGQAFSFYLRLPLDTLATAPNGSTAWKNGVLYGKWNGRFDAIGGGGGATDTSFLSARIDARVRYSDTLNMLSKYLRKSDTANMLSKYLRKVDTLSLSNRIDAITDNYYSNYFVAGAQFKSLYGVDQDGITRLLASWQDLMSDSGSLAQLSGIDTAFNGGSSLSFVKNGNTWNIPFVSSFNGRTGAVIPQLGDYSTFFATTNHTHLDLTPLTRFNDSLEKHWAAIMSKGTGGATDDSAIVRIENIGDTIHRYFRRNGEAAYDVKLDCSTCGTSGTGTGGSTTPDANKLDSVRLVGRILKEYRGAVATNIATTAMYNWNNPQNGDYVVYHDDGLTNITPPVGSGGGIVGADSSYVAPGGLYVFVGDYRYFIAYTDSVPTTPTTPPASYDADAVAYFTAEENAGATITAPQKDAYNAIVVAFKSAGVYTKYKAGYTGLGNGLINAKTPGTYNATNVGSVVVDANGYTFNGSNYLSTPFRDADMSVDAMAIALYIKSQNTGTSTFGDLSSGAGTYFFPSDGATSVLRLQASGDANVANTTTAGLYVMARQGAFIRVTKNGTQAFYDTQTQTGRGTDGYKIGALGSNGNAAVHMTGTLGGIFFFDGTLSNTEMTAVNNAISTFITTLGRN